MQQEKALAILKSGKNVFLTGSAGTGKTYVLNQYITYLKERKVPVAVTASTGIAATHMNGMTIHSWSGIGVKEQLTEGNLQNMKSKKYLRDHLENTKVLIIDEISMLHKKQLELVDKVLRYFKDPFLAFGGIQVVLCGDFFQLPPIGRSEETSKDKFSFMSEAWLNAKLTVCYLTEQFRQSDNQLNFILNEIRQKNISDNSLEQLRKAANNALDHDEPTKLFTHNVDVDNINAEHLMTLKEKAKSYQASTKGNKKLVETLKNTVLAAENLTLKIGAKVMFVKNNNEKAYVNGSMGRVIEFNDDGQPLVKMYNGKVITVEEESWMIIDDNGKTLASYKQIPLRLAWAITVHKCQGMTLDAAEIDLTKTFERGQGYVALSRLKKLENLKLSGLNDTALQVDDLAYRADKRFMELSEDADNEFALNELETQAHAFIKASGGLVDKKEITKHKQKLKEKAKGKISTLATTLLHLKAKKSLEEIAEIRGLTIGTISGHLLKIRKTNPDEDLSFYRPDESIMKKVAKVHKELPEDTATHLGPIYNALNGEVSYDDIKLALAFL